MDLNSVIYDISRWFTGSDSSTCAMLDDIQEMISEKDFDKALEISGQLAEMADTLAEAVDFSSTEYYNFNEPMESTGSFTSLRSSLNMRIFLLLTSTPYAAIYCLSSKDTRRVLRFTARLSNGILLQ